MTQHTAGIFGLGVKAVVHKPTGNRYSGYTIRIDIDGKDREQDAIAVYKAFATANAHLIAAAPELLALLEELAPFITINRNGLALDAFLPGTVGDKILATISKARGEG